MTQLSDVSCVVKVIDTTDGTRVPDKGAVFGSSNQAIVRYVVVNDSDVPAGPFTLAGSLFRNGVVLLPNGRNVVSEQALTLPPKHLWKKEVPVSESTFSASYIAQLEARGSAKEEDGNNNHAITTFSVNTPPR